MSRYLDGEFDADLDTLHRIAAAFDHPVTALLDATTSAHESEAIGTPTTLGALHRGAVTPLHVKMGLATFAARYRPKTCRELRRLLGWVYVTLDGADARNPARGVKGPRVRYDDPRGIDYDVIGRILAALPDRGRPVRGQTRPTVNLTKCRLAVMAFTGMHQSEVGKLTPRDVDLARRRVWIGARVKGAGAEGAWHTLTAPGVAALRAFADAGAWGPFGTRSMAKSWRRALAVARARWEAETREPWPVRDDARPYDLRHSFGTAVLLATGDRTAAQAMLRHRQASTTDRYTRAGVSARVAAAVVTLDSFLPRAATTEDRGSVPKRPPMSARPHLARGRASGQK
ncbi:MAG: tyrosine-type recombinase/integrase [Candidatus Eisenbacteria bacterium]|nr:tyrosine-type recombinase/integrase [Candidatus Eisenbacteria bacterium]